jgi:hypothetical protein
VGCAWNQVSSPNRGTIADCLAGVAVVGANDVWAVGDYIKGSGVDQSYRTLVEHWNGTGWTAASSPNAGSGDYLTGVAAAAPHDVWAVGHYQGKRGEKTLAEHWNGRTWKIVPTPDLGRFDNYLMGVAVAGSHNVWAVGEYSQHGTVYRTLVEHWNGRSWTIVHSPNVGPSHNALAAVTVGGGRNVWAVGHYERGTNDTYHTLAEHWNGSSWAVVATPNVVGTHNFSRGDGFDGVTAAGRHDVWAVGFHYDDGRAANRSLIEHWNGNSWSVMSTPTVGDRDYPLAAAVRDGIGGVWAVGTYDDTQGHAYTLTEHAAGASWSVVSSVSPGYLNGLQGVGVVGPGDAWAVGSFTSSTSSFASQTLILRYGPSA